MLILDEPTSSLDADEVRELFRVIRDLRDAGVAVLFVSHFLDQVYEIADRITILRNGRLVGEYPLAELLAAGDGQEDGRPGAGRARPTSTASRRTDVAELPDAPVLAAAGLGRTGAIAPVDLAVHPGEVLGLAGLLGSGRTELARLLFGADHADSGTVAVDGRPDPAAQPASTPSPRGIAFCSEDRKGEGIVGELTVRDNIVLALQARRGWARPAARGAPPTSSSRSGSRRSTSARRPGRAHPQPLRRQPAEGAAGPLAASPSRGC